MSDARTTALERQLVDGVAEKHGVTPVGRELLRGRLHVTEDGRVVSRDGKAPEALVDEFRANPDFASAFPGGSNGSNGTAAPKSYLGPDGEPIPWAKMTQVQQIDYCVDVYGDGDAA